MSRKIMVVTAAYGAEQVRQAGGQRAMLPVIAGAGADGVEIRRELFNSEELLALPALGESIELLGLLACYSAPAALFMPDGTLNPDLPRYLSEASTLNALWLKVSLGHFSGNPLKRCARCSMKAVWHWWSKTIRPTAASLLPCSASRPPAGRWHCPSR